MPSDKSLRLSVGVPGLEPGKTGPESVVLPITPYPKLSLYQDSLSITGANLQAFSIYTKQKCIFFEKNRFYSNNIPAECPILSIFHLKIIIHHGCSAILHGCSAILHDHHFETISSRDKSIKCANRHWKRNCGQFPEFS